MDDPRWALTRRDYRDEDPGRLPGRQWGHVCDRAGQTASADESNWPRPVATDDESNWPRPVATDDAPPWGAGQTWDEPRHRGEGRHWAEPSSTGAPPPDDDPYWGEPPPWPDVEQPEQWDDEEQQGRSWDEDGAVPESVDLDPAPYPATRGRRIWIPIVAVVVACVTLAAGIVFTRHHKPAGNRTAGQSPASSVGAPAQQGPITVASLFPQTHLGIDGRQFNRVATATTTNCAAAANGAFAAALSSGKCERVVRATYVDTHKQYAVTVGVAAMPNRAAALKVDAVKRFGPDVWFTALNGPAHSGASAAAKTVGVGSDVVDGKFIVFALSSYANGQNPTGHSPEVQTLTGLSRSFTDQMERQLANQPKS